MIKKMFFDKNICLNISNLKLSGEKIYKILSLFNYESIAIFIDSLKIESNVYNQILSYNMKNDCIYKNDLYVSIALVLDDDNLELLDEILKLNNDLFIFNVVKKYNSSEFLKNLKFENLIKKDISNITIDLWKTENKIYINYKSKSFFNKKINDEILKILEED